MSQDGAQLEKKAGNQKMNPVPTIITMPQNTAQ